MKRFNDYTIRSFVLFLAVILLAGSSAKADFTFGTPTNLGSVVNSSAYDEAPSISADGLTLYFNSNRPGGHGTFDLWKTTRSTKESAWGLPENLGPTVNSSAREGGASISADGLSLYFNSTRPGGYGPALWGDIWVTERATTSETWDEPVNLGPIVNSSSHAFGASISYDGLSLFFGSDSADEPGNDDICVTTRATIDDHWQEPVNLGFVVNSSAHDGGPSISSDGLALFFSGYAIAPYRSGGYGNADLWITIRSAVSDTWGEPVNLGPAVNTSYYDFLPCISSDGRTLYFMSDRPGGYGLWDLWQASIIPIVDFNGDGNINIDDLLIMMDNWSTDNSLCDIGPMPWGDGVVDIEDLRIFIEYWEMENFINVDDDDNGSKVTLKQDQRLVVTLESNPSTGYTWAVVENPDSILAQQGESEFLLPEQTDPPMVGAGGWEVFRFKAISAGQETLELIYRRSWETDVEPIKTFSIDVTVN